MRDLDEVLVKTAMSVVLTIAIFSLITLVFLICWAVFHSPEKTLSIVFIVGCVFALSYRIVDKYIFH